MKRLLNDVSRCMGQGHGRTICRKRQECLRYLDRGQPGDSIRMVTMMCRYSDFEHRIPVEGKREGGK